MPVLLSQISLFGKAPFTHNSGWHHKRRQRVIFFTIFVILTVVFAASAIITSINTFSANDAQTSTTSPQNTTTPFLSNPATSSITKTVFASTPTPTPTLTPEPTPTDTPTSTPKPTPTLAPLPTGKADCSGGQSIGWNKWSPNPANAWINNGATIVNTNNTIETQSPSLIGPPCGLLKRGSRVTIVFTITGDGNLYLRVQGADVQGSHWYSIDFNPRYEIIEQDGNDLASSNTPLSLNQSYTFTMEMATDGNVYLRAENGGIILQTGLSFTPTGQWGLGAFYGSFSVSSVSVN